MAIAFFSFASVVVATRFLGSSGYGTIVAVISASYLGQIVVNWTTVSLSRFGIEEFVEAGRISKSFWARTVIYLPNTILFLALSFLWLPIMADWLKLPPEAQNLVLAHFVTLSLWMHVQYALQAAKLASMQSILLAIERIIIFAGLVLLGVSGRLDFVTATWMFIGSPLIVMFVGLFLIRNYVSWRVEIDGPWLRRMLRFSFPLIPYWLIGYFATNFLDSIFISQYMSKTDLGVYSVAYQINGIMMQLPVLAGTLMMPLFVTMNSNRQEATVERFLVFALPILILGWGLLCLVSAIGISWTLPMVFGSGFVHSGELLLIIAISSIVNGPVLIGFGPFINSKSASFIALSLAVALGLVNVTANIVLIPKYGLEGCAIATSLAYFASLVTILIIVRYRYPVQQEWTLQAVIPGVSGLVLAWWFSSPIVGVFVGIAFTLLVGGLYLRRLRIGLEFLLSYRDWWHKRRVV